MEPPEAPRQFGKYEVRDSLGEGGMGKVWLAWDPYLDVCVAIKELHPGVSERRLQAEARYIRHLNKSSAVVKVYDFEPQSELHSAYYVMEYMSGGVLGDKNSPYPFKAQPGKPGRIRKCIQILGPVAKALDEAHALGIFHCDVKPTNILFDEKDEPRLSDFSIARWDDLADEAEPAHASTDSQETAIRPYWAGTPEYMAPELLMSEGEHPTKHSDCYSLAVVAFQMLTNRLPLNLPTVPDPDAQVRYEHYRSQHADGKVIDMAINILRESGDKYLHKGYQRVFKRALARDPASRYEKASYFIKALREEMLRGPDAPVRVSELPGFLTAKTGEGSEGTSAETYRFLRRLGVWALGIWMGFTAAIVFLWLWGDFANATPDFVLSGTWRDAMMNGGPRVFAARLPASWGFIVVMNVLMLTWWICRLGARVAERADVDRCWKHANRLKDLTSGLEKYLECAYEQHTTVTDSGHPGKVRRLNGQELRLRLRGLGFRNNPDELNCPDPYDNKDFKASVGRIVKQYDKQNKLWTLQRALDSTNETKLKRDDDLPYQRAQLRLGRLACCILAIYITLLVTTIPALSFTASEFGVGAMFWAMSGLLALWAMGILVLWRVVSLEYLGRKEAQTLKGS